MKKLNLLVIFLFAVSLMNAQTEKALSYHNALEFKIIGKGFTKTEAPYDRLPFRLKDTMRTVLWNLSKNSAGIAIRFRSNTTSIGFKWEVLSEKNMNHMAATGVRGLDLYSFVDKRWQYMCTARPTGKNSHVNLISNMEPSDREYMLYLPLYDGTVSVEIGIDPDAMITKPELPLPKTGKPIVFYGTSITQGGCASRPGMVYSSIIGRKMNIETVNLGFSGNGWMDWDVLEAMLTIDASCYVIDCLPNCGIDRVRERGYKFISRILNEKKGIPVLMVGEVGYTQGYFDNKIKISVAEKNAEWVKIFEQLKKEGYTDLYYLSPENLIGNDYEGTVDGRHFTDLGFQRCAEKMLEILVPVMKSRY